MMSMKHHKMKAKFLRNCKSYAVMGRCSKKKADEIFTQLFRYLSHLLHPLEWNHRSLILKVILHISILFFIVNNSLLYIWIVFRDFCFVFVVVMLNENDPTILKLPKHGDYTSIEYSTTIAFAFTVNTRSRFL